MVRETDLRPTGCNVIFEALEAGAVFKVDVEVAPAEGQGRALAQAIAEMKLALEREVGTDAETADVEAAGKSPLVAERCFEPQADHRIDPLVTGAGPGGEGAEEVDVGIEVDVAGADRTSDSR